MRTAYLVEDEELDAVILGKEGYNETEELGIEHTVTWHTARTRRRDKHQHYGRTV